MIRRNLLLDDMGLSGGLKTANLTTVVNNYKLTPTETYESIKLGIGPHSKRYYVAQQLDGTNPRPVQKMDF